MPSASCCFLLVFYIAEYQYQTESEHRETFWRIFMDQNTQDGPEQHLGGCPEGGTTHQGMPGPPGAPRWVVPTSVASRTPSSPYKSSNIPKSLAETLDQKFCRRKP